MRGKTAALAGLLAAAACAGAPWKEELLSASVHAPMRRLLVHGGGPEARELPAALEAEGFKTVASERPVELPAALELGASGPAALEALRRSTGADGLVLVSAPRPGLLELSVLDARTGEPALKVRLAARGPEAWGDPSSAARAAARALAPLLAPREAPSRDGRPKGERARLSDGEIPPP